MCGMVHDIVLRCRSKRRPYITQQCQRLSVLDMLHFVNLIDLQLIRTVDAYTHMHKHSRIPTDRSCGKIRTKLGKALYIESMTAPITEFFLKIWFIHIKRCVKKKLISYVFETCLLQDFEKKDLCISCA